MNLLIVILVSLITVGVIGGFWWCVYHIARTILFPTFPDLNFLQCLFFGTLVIVVLRIIERRD